MKDLSKIFNPKSIAFIGASENVPKWGSFLYTNIVEGGYTGKVYPVSQKKDKVFGTKAYKSVLDIPEEIDLAYMAIPAKFIPQTLIECAEKNINNVVIISSGFSEIGGEGNMLEEECIKIAEANNMNIVGPNCMGVLNTAVPLYGAGNHVRPTSGGISLISHSGNVGIQLMDWAKNESIGIAKFVGVGNEASLTSIDYLEYFGEDKETAVIMLYLEGIEDGRRFFEVAKRISMKKPIVAFKAGKTEKGSQAAASHTGALAGSISVFKGAMKQAGVVMVDSLAELLLVSAVFDNIPIPKGNRVCIVTYGGGWGVVAADECEKFGLKLPELPEDVFKVMNDNLPGYWSKTNPIDIVGVTDFEKYKKIGTSVVSSDAFDIILVLGIIGSIKIGSRVFLPAQKMGIEGLNIEGINTIVDKMVSEGAKGLMNEMDKTGKPIFSVPLVIFKEEPIVKREEGYKSGLIAFRTPEEAVNCIRKQVEYFNYVSQRSQNE